jgi:hypothetical protein
MSDRIDELPFLPTSIEKQPGPDGCWLWVGALDKDGYGRTNTAEYGKQYVHRLAYMILVGPIPEGLTIDHLCRVRNCFRPKHLEPVSQMVNVMRGETQARFKTAQTSCVNGHPFDEKNTGVKYPPSHPNGMRYCRQCNLDSDARRRAKQKKARELAIKHADGQKP